MFLLICYVCFGRHSTVLLLLVFLLWHTCSDWSLKAITQWTCHKQTSWKCGYSCTNHFAWEPFRPAQVRFGVITAEVFVTEYFVWPSENSCRLPAITVRKSSSISGIEKELSTERELCLLTQERFQMSMGHNEDLLCFLVVPRLRKKISWTPFYPELYLVVCLK